MSNANSGNRISSGVQRSRQLTPRQFDIVLFCPYPCLSIMKVLVIGSGGREHALVWKLRQSPRVTRLYCAPGNGGIAEEAECLPVDVKSLDSLVALAMQVQPELTVIGPELP